MGPHIRTARISVGIAAVALTFGAGAAQAGSAEDTALPEETVECVLLTAEVERDNATFTVGPEGCVGEVGPISFSSFFLPGGMREPYEDHVLIAHHDSDGAFYGAGNYELTIYLGTPCNWQTDLYFGVNLMPKFSGLIAYDYDDREVCVDETTTTTSVAETTTTTTTTTTTAVPAAAGGEATSTSVASAGLSIPAGDDRTLPSTGPWTVSIFALIAGLLVAAGLFTRRLARY